MQRAATTSATLILQHMSAISVGRLLTVARAFGASPLQDMRLELKQCVITQSVVLPTPELRCCFYPSLSSKHTMKRFRAPSTTVTRAVMFSLAALLHRTLSLASATALLLFQETWSRMHQLIVPTKTVSVASKVIQASDSRSLATSHLRLALSCLMLAACSLVGGQRTYDLGYGIWLDLSGRLIFSS